MSDVSFSPRSKVRRAFSRMFWRLGFRWYGISARIGEAAGVPVRPAASIDELVARVGGEGHYRPDRTDTMRHPRLVQRAIDDGRALGDCDDHAAYWCAVLLKSGLATVACLAQIHMERDRKPVGHAFALFQVSGRPGWFAADYGPPSFGATARDACAQMARDHNARPLFAAWMRVELRADDGLRMRGIGAGKAVWR